MRLTAWEEERLLIFGAAELARRHLAAGLLLNAPEAVALICDAMLEAARAGRSYADVEAAGLAAVRPDQVLPGVRELVEDVRVEVLFGDGARLVVLVDPLAAGTAPSADGPGAIVPGETVPGEIVPGEIVPASRSDGEPGEAAWMLLPASAERREVSVANSSRRVVRVSSHYPFDQVNPRLRFDRSITAGFHLDIPAGSSERWGPGETRTIRLVRHDRDGHRNEVSPPGETGS